MNDALILAKRHEFDVFNALDILHNEEYLKVPCPAARCHAVQQDVLTSLALPAHRRLTSRPFCLPAWLQELKFGIGDGALQYYLFNWRCPPAPPNQVGLVLL